MDNMRSRCIQTELFGQCLSKYFFWLGGFQSSLLRPVSDRRAKGCVTYAHCITWKLWKFVFKKGKKVNRPLLYRLSPNARKHDETFNNLKKKNSLRYSLGGVKIKDGMPLQLTCFQTIGFIHFRQPLQVYSEVENR